jgi:hypothetical protein
MGDPTRKVGRRAFFGRGARAGAAAVAGAVTAPGLLAGVASAQDLPGGGLPDDLIVKGPTPWIDVRAYGAVADGITDDSPALVKALTAAYTGRGGRTPVYLPAGIYRIDSPLRLPSNVTLFGDGSRPGDQGGTEIRYSGRSGSAVVAGEAGRDWSNSQIRALRVVRDPGTQMTSGWGIEVFNPTNVSTITDVLVSGFPDGQLYVSNGPGGDHNPGANFFKLSNFFLIGGRRPLFVERGRQTVFIQFGGIDTDDTSEGGMFLETGEAQAHVTTVEAVKVESRTRDVPGFHVSGIAPVTFIGCTFYNIAKTGTRPAFLYTNATQPDLQTELLGCTSLGTSVFFAAPERNVSIPADPSRGHYSPHLTVAGGGGMVVPMNTRTEGNRTWAMHKDVKMGWTGDSGSRAEIDTVLYRGGKGRLKTDGGLTAAGGVTTKVVNGAVSDASFDSPPPDGTMALDAKSSRLYVRVAGKWRKVQLG